MAKRKYNMFINEFINNYDENIKLLNENDIKKLKTIDKMVSELLCDLLEKYRQKILDDETAEN